MHLGLKPEHAEQCNWKSFINTRNTDVSKVFTGVCIVQIVMYICYKLGYLDAVSGTICSIYA